MRGKKVEEELLKMREEIANVKGGLESVHETIRRIYDHLHSLDNAEEKLRLKDVDLIYDIKDVRFDIDKIKGRIEKLE